MRISYSDIRSPIGKLWVAWHDEALIALAFGGPMGAMRKSLARRFGTPELRKGKTSHEFVRALESYFRGDLAALERIPVDPGGTPFRKRVWQALRSVPAGRTVAYGELAERAGRQGAARAVGAAMGANPIPVVIPCHRVVGSDGSLTGFGGGLPRKQWLLQHEGAMTEVGEWRGAW